MKIPHARQQKKILILIAVLSAGGLWLAARGGVEAPAVRLPRVTVVTAQLEPWSDTLEAIGTARANESLDITANVTETIAEIHFQDGQEVEVGAPIVSLALGEEAAELAAANARLEEERRELKRLEPLLASKAVAQRLYDERRTAVVLAERAVQQVKARVGDRVITAPFSGVLGLRYVSVGSLVEPGDLITTLDDIETIKLDFPVPSVYLSSVQIGSVVRAQSPAYPDQQFAGTVSSVDSRIDTETRALIVRALLENPQHHLKPGMLMTVSLQKNPRQAVTVPEEALLLQGQTVYAFVVGDDRTVQRVEVRTGERRDGRVEITDGLREGDAVVVRGQQNIRHGQEVEAHTEDGVQPAPMTTDQ
jgi:membrane fusion protein (multidrug efflux system)